jgi:hypothetical protein
MPPSIIRWRTPSTQEAPKKPLRPYDLLTVFWERSWVRFILPLLLSIRPPVLTPLLTILSAVLPVFDACLMADAGGEKRANRKE